MVAIARIFRSRSEGSMRGTSRRETERLQAGAVLRPIAAGRVALLALVALAALAFTARAEAQGRAEEAPPTVHERVDVTAVTVPVRAEFLSGPKGALSPQLSARDLSVTEDGVPRRVVSLLQLSEAVAGPARQAGGEPVAPAGGPLPRIVLYVDPRLVGAPRLRELLRAAEEKVDRLVAVGSVEVIVAEAEPRTVAGPGHEPGELRRALRALAARAGALGPIERIRRDLWRGLGEGTLGVRQLLAARAAEEAAILRDRRRVLVSWAAGAGVSGAPRVLFVVSGPYDADLADFYLGVFERRAGRAGADGAAGETALLRSDLRALHQGPLDEELGRLLSDLGWMVFAAAPADLAHSSFGGADESGHGRWVAFGRGSQGGAAGSPQFLFDHPLAGWGNVARATGGEALGSPEALREALGGVGELLLLTYERPHAPDGSVHELRVEAEGWRLAAPTRIAEGTPESAAGIAAVELLSCKGPAGDLALTLDLAAAAAEDSRREVRVRVRADVARTAGVAAPGFGRAVRLSLAVETPGAPPRVLHQQTLPVPVADGTAWLFDLDVALEPGATRIAVRIEDLTTGLWGASCREVR